jgi:ABC-type branched-subunit amino acid transport system ATPase component
VAAQALLVVEDLHKNFGGVAAVDGASLVIPEGAVVGLIGPNGAGKSSLIDLVSGFTRADRGSVQFLGVEILGKRPDQIARLGLIRTFQSPREWGGLTVMDNVLLGGCKWERESIRRTITSARRLRREDHADRESAREILERFGLTSVKNAPAARLSGGQKRLLEFARIAAASPKLVILDEPMGGVNPVLGERIGQAVSDFAARGSTVVIVEHNLPFIEHTCDVVVVMDLGSVIAEGPFASLRQDARVVSAYLGSEDSDV